MDPDGGFTLADPALPIDPETIARRLGAALADAHSSAPAGDDQRSLVAVAAELAAKARGQFDPLESGPYAGRTPTDLAALASRLVADLPESTDLSVSVRPGLTLDDFRLMPDGGAGIDGATAPGDRHLDLAAVAVDLADRFGPATVGPMLESYGLDRVNSRYLDACQLLVSLERELSQGWQVRPVGP